MKTNEEFDVEYRNSLVGRYSESLKRGKEYCQYHPSIHPDNKQKIRLVAGEISVPQEDKTMREEKFMHCPKCHVIYR